MPDASRYWVNCNVRATIGLFKQCNYVYIHDTFSKYLGIGEIVFTQLGEPSRIGWEALAYIVSRYYVTNFHRAPLSTILAPTPCGHCVKVIKKFTVFFFFFLFFFLTDVINIGVIVIWGSPRELSGKEIQHLYVPWDNVVAEIKQLTTPWQLPNNSLLQLYCCAP